MKRGFTLLCCVFGALAALPLRADTTRWDFSVLLDGKAIGEHSFVLEHNGEQRELVSRARFNVKLFFIPAYRYVHEARERWQDNCLRELQSDTDDNGTHHRVRTRTDNDTLRVESNGKVSSLSGCVMSFAYWNPAMLTQSRLLNAQNGEYQTVSITALGKELITVKSQKINASRYALRGTTASGEKLHIDLWYSPAGDWLQLESVTDGGKHLRYVLKPDTAGNAATNRTSS